MWALLGPTTSLLQRQEVCALGPEYISNADSLVQYYSVPYLGLTHLKRRIHNYMQLVVTAEECMAGNWVDHEVATRSLFGRRRGGCLALNEIPCLFFGGWLFCVFGLDHHVGTKKRHHNIIVPALCPGLAENQQWREIQP